jgi:UDP-sulfoquinovose synthase
MRILVQGGDGYLGWPTAMYLAQSGHSVCVVDNYLKRWLSIHTQSQALIPNPDLQQRAAIFHNLTGKRIQVAIGDVTNFGYLYDLYRWFRPQAVVHYAEQPAAPYGMTDYAEAHLTLNNNLNATFNTIWAIIRTSLECHIIKLGTMGEYGTPDIDIEEGWIEIEHQGRKDTFLYPRQAGSLYHTTKIMDTDMLWFYVRSHLLKVTDLMQGPVYGLITDQTCMDDRLLPNFHYDDVFGTVLNRFIVQAIAGVPLTVYGQGFQKRGFIDIRDTVRCIELAAHSPPASGEMRIMNQITQVFSIIELAEMVKRAGREMGLDVKIDHYNNPRLEKERHYYNPKHSALADLGLSPHYLNEVVIEEMMRKIAPWKSMVDLSKIEPRRRETPWRF